MTWSITWCCELWRERDNLNTTNNPDIVSHLYNLVFPSCPRTPFKNNEESKFSMSWFIALHLCIRSQSSHAVFISNGSWFVFWNDDSQLGRPDMIRSRMGGQRAKRPAVGEPAHLQSWSSGTQVLFQSLSSEGGSMGVYHDLSYPCLSLSDLLETLQQLSHVCVISVFWRQHLSAQK